MTFIILPNETIQTIQEHFISLFSHLKLEFYKSSHGQHEGNHLGEQYLHNIPLHEITGIHETLEMELKPTMKTKDLETMFETKFHIHVQLMRKQRGVWLQTTSSDDQTLEEQNLHGLQADQKIQEQLSMEYDDQ